jgi:hypothetical protein
MLIEFEFGQQKKLVEFSRLYYPEKCIQIDRDLSGKARILTITAVS